MGKDSLPMQQQEFLDNILSTILNLALIVILFANLRLERRR
jgi:mannose/fructose/N-acetylgalactosamine-specific phosphotransferase system component IID